MICTNCGNEDFSVVRVLRNRKLRKGKYKVSENIDSRELLCNTCGRRFITETTLVGEITYRNYRNFIKEYDGEYEYEQKKDN